MRILEIPAYSYFDNSHSYRTDVTLLCDNELLNRLYAEYGECSQLNVWSESGLASGYKDFASRINKFFKTTLLSSKVATYSIYNSNSYNPTSQPVLFNIFNGMDTYSGISMKTLQIDDTINIPTGQSYVNPLNTYALNNSKIHNLNIGNINNKAFGNLYDNLTINGRYLPTDFGTIQCYYHLTIIPENIFDTAGHLISQDEYNNLPKSFHATIYFNCNIDQEGIITDIYSYSVVLTYYGSVYSSLLGMFSEFIADKKSVFESVFDDDNPYGEEGSSTTGGGDGGGGAAIDSVDPAAIPALPALNICDLGLITMYNPSESDIRSLANFLWSSVFDLNTYKKLFQDPMEGIIGLAIVPCSPSIGGARNVKIGNIDSGINMSVLSSNWKEIDCGWCNVEKYVGCFMDSDPYTKISIYLPFIGIRDLSADDINGGSIHVVYHVDLLTGACACFIEHNTRGVIYTYNGSCITNVPLTASNFSGAIQNAVSAVISGIGMVAGAATGAAPVTAMGAMGLLTSAANTAINSKAHIQRSGNLGGSAGILSILTPYVIIERPNMSVPYNMQHYVGQTSNITMNLGTCHGFTLCEYVHLDGISATSDEISEMESLLKAGVIL